MKAVKLLTINKEIIHAHGGGIFKLNDTYYLYGENRNENNFVSMYKSKDLKHFEFCNNILTTNSLELSINPQYKLGLKVKGRKVNIERPKIFYSEILKKYVLNCKIVFTITAEDTKWSFAKQASQTLKR